MKNMRDPSEPTARQRLGAGHAELPTIVLVPGAWMGDWIWDDTVLSLRALGHRVCSLTLPGLHEDAAPIEVSGVTLSDHVRALRAHLTALRAKAVVLVAHSYSGVVVGQVADQRPDLVKHTVHIGSFLPRDGRSLIEDWGAAEDAREQERAQVVAARMLWAPPQRAGLDGDSSLCPAQRDWLLERFVPHPGRTILDRARLAQPVTTQRATYVTDTTHGAPLPPELTTGIPPTWQVRHLSGGHWPMLTNPVNLTHMLHDEVHAAARLLPA